MTIARQFNVLVSSVILLVLAFSATLVYQFATLSEDGARLVANLQQTSSLSRELARGNSEHILEVQRQFVQPEPRTAEHLAELNYRLGEKYVEYLKLNIGVPERLTVERAKALQSEASLLATRIVVDLAEQRPATAGRVRRLYDLHDEIRTELDRLNDLQLATLRAVVVHLNELATKGLVAVGTLVGLLVVAAVAFSFGLRRRILSPIRAILTASDRIRQGDLTARIRGRKADEFGRLTDGFNFMAEALAESYASLERKVEDRANQLREVQAKLDQAEKLSAVGLLVSGVAHELNNPLATIRGFAELAKMELTAGGDCAKAAGLLEEADAQVERCRGIIANLLQFARQHEPQREVVRLNDLIARVISLRQYELATRNITIVREFDPTDPVLSADPGKMQQVVLNLLNNANDAIQGAHRAGTIWIRTRAVATGVEIEFRDDGPGFLDASRAFDPFYTTKDVGEGTGLGLSVCYGIVEEHGGEILAGNWDRGARVAITLPVGEPDAPQVVGPPMREGAGLAAGVPTENLGLRALVVDDEKMLVRLQVSLLSKMGIQAVGATTGAEAIRHLQEHDVDLIVSDVRMPGDVDGVQLYEWILANRPGLALRFIFTSGDLFGLSLSEFFRQSPVPRIEKPFAFAQYSDLVRRVLASGGRES